MKLSNELECLQIICDASGSRIQWAKFQYCRQSLHDLPAWLADRGWAWIQPGKFLKFLGILHASQASPKELWDVVIYKVKEKIDRCG